jgi:TPR repeat protein
VRRADPEAQLRLGLMHAIGDQVPKNAALARKWLLKAAEAGNVDAMYQLGKFAHAGLFAGKPKAVVAFKKTLKPGAHSPEETRSLTQDDAISWWRRAADRGHAGAAVALGKALEAMPDKAAEARSHLLSAARIAVDPVHVATSSLKAASALLRGVGGPVDAALARKLVGHAAATRDPLALFAQAVVLRCGIGGTRDLESARQLAQEAAAVVPEAQLLVAWMAQNGEGGDVDSALARSMMARYAAVSETMTA